MKQEIEQNIELATLFMMLKDHGTTHILVSFSGGGDSGACEAAYAVHPEQIDEEGNITFEAWDAEGVLEDYEFPCIQDNLDVLADLVLPYLYDHDWWNNEGGDGHIVFSIIDHSFKVVYNICGEDTADYKEDEYGDIDYDSAEPEYEYDNYYVDGTITIK
jgi:hypothetical protein